VIRELLEARAGEDYELYARTINPQFMRVLRTIGFDRVWRAPKGQYLYDAEGNRFLDMLGGFGMFNMGAITHVSARRSSRHSSSRRPAR